MELDIDNEIEVEIENLLKLHNYKINRDEAIVLLKRNER